MTDVEQKFVELYVNLMKISILLAVAAMISCVVVRGSRVIELSS